MAKTNLTKKKKKMESIYLKCSPEFKKRLKLYVVENDTNVSDFLRSLAEEKMNE